MRAFEFFQLLTKLSLNQTRNLQNTKLSLLIKPIEQLRFLNITNYYQEKTNFQCRIKHIFAQ